ncbi:MAG: hypothetical protein RSD95_00550 [Clostridia bacterium]
MQEELMDIIKSVIDTQFSVNMDVDENLFWTRYAFSVSDVLFITKCIEKRLGKHIMNIFGTNDSGVMTIRNLAAEIAAL